MTRTIPTVTTPTVIALAAAILAGCSGAPGGAPRGTEPQLLVVNGGDGTVTRLDSTSGQTLGSPLPVGPRPAAAVAGPDGSALVFPLSFHLDPFVTHVSPAGSSAALRRLPITDPVEEAFLAGDGGRYAAVAYGVQHRAADRGQTPRCRLTLVDLQAGAIVATHTVCGAREVVGGLALDGGPAGMIAHVGLWQPVARDGDEAAAGGRLVAVNAETGAAVATLPLGGAPRLLTLASAPGRSGQRLYGVEAPADPDSEPSAAYRGRLLGLDPVTLAVESALPLREPPSHLAVAPDGDDAYLLSEGRVLRLDLVTGATSSLAAAPERAFGLAVTERRVYVSDAKGGAVWALDRRRGTAVQRIATGRRPSALTLSPPPAALEGTR